MEPSPTLLADPLLPASPKPRRRVGRPKVSKGRVTQGPRVLGAQHFAFLRECLFLDQLMLRGVTSLMAIKAMSEVTTA
jgi:hypothetical protein